MAVHPEFELIPYLRDELDERGRDRVTSHLGGCPNCRAQIDGLRQAIRLISNRIDELPAPDTIAFRADLRRRLAVRVERKQPWWRATIVWAPAAAVVAVTVVTLLARHRPETRPMVDQLAVNDVISRTDVGLLRNYPMVERLDLLENDNYEVIEHLDELVPPSNDVHQS
jgi:anti-sigma factor RsiW